MVSEQRILGQEVQAITHPVASVEGENNSSLYGQITEAVIKAAEGFPRDESTNQEPIDMVQRALEGYPPVIRAAFNKAERALGIFIDGRLSISNLPLGERVHKLAQIWNGIREKKFGKRGGNTSLTWEEETVDQAFRFEGGSDINFLKDSTDVSIPFLTHAFSEDADKRNAAFLTRVAQNVGILRGAETWEEFIERAKKAGLGMEPRNFTPSSQLDPLREPVVYNNVPTTLPGISAGIFFCSTARTDNSLPLGKSITDARRLPIITLGVPTTEVLA